jgi:hypothetical protein
MHVYKTFDAQGRNGEWMISKVKTGNGEIPKIVTPNIYEIVGQKRQIGLGRGLASDRYFLSNDKKSIKEILVRKASPFTVEEVQRETSKRGLKGQLTQETIVRGASKKYALVTTHRNPSLETPSGKYKEFFEKGLDLPALQTRFGLYNKNFQMSGPDITENVHVQVRNFEAIFSIKCGSLVWDGKPLKDTFVLELHYKGSEDTHASRLPLDGFGSALCYDYAGVAQSLAQAFVAMRGWTMNDHLNSWPQFQAIVSRTPGKE